MKAMKSVDTLNCIILFSSVHSVKLSWWIQHDEFDTHLTEVSVGRFEEVGRIESEAVDWAAPHSKEEACRPKQTTTLW